jgi:transcriptional regulator, TetR family
MSRGFTQEEKIIISNALIEALEEELRSQKLNKISIEDLVKKVGISKGSFYNFFPSKEILFSHVVNNIQQKLILEIMSIANKEQITNKNKLKLILTTIVEKLQSNSWLQDLNSGEFEVILRKLPEDLKKSLSSQDIIDFKNILEQLNLESKLPIKRFVTIIQIILLSTTRAKDFGSQYNKSIETMINLLVDNLFDDK